MLWEHPGDQTGRADATQRYLHVLTHQRGQEDLKTHLLYISHLFVSHLEAPLVIANCWHKNLLGNRMSNGELLIKV